jgi:prophage antirepressor-like protein
MDILKAFSLNDQEYPVNIQGTVDDPLFQANQIGKLLDMKNINKVLSTFDSDEKVSRETCTPGGVQNVSFLTEKGLLRILGRSNKPIARTFQKWMANVIQELRRNGIVRLREEHEIESQLIRAHSKNTSEKNIHNTLLQFCHKKNVVYVCKLREEDANGQFIIKIGSTQNIKERLARIATTYGLIPVLLNIFDCEKHVQFESWVRNNELLKPFRFKLMKLDNTETRETFMVNEDHYKQIVTLMQQEMKNFSAKEPEQFDIDKHIELEKCKQANAKIDIQLEELRLLQEDSRRKQKEIEMQQEELIYKQEELLLQRQQCRNTELELQLQLQKSGIQIQESAIDNSTYATMDASNNSVFVKTRENVRSPKVYQYDPITLDLIQIYDSIITFVRHFHSSSACALKEAAKHCKEYKGFRWMLVDRNATEDPVVLPTVVSNTSSIEYIAMIDIKQTHILEVFPSQKEAAMARNLAGFSTISRAIKKNSISSGHYWQLYRLCSPEMRDAYLQDHALPEPHVKSNGTTVQQLHPMTGEVVKTFPSIMEVQKHFQMSRASLYAASNQQTAHHGFKWKVVTAEIDA